LLCRKTTFQNQPDAFDLVITDQTMPSMTGSDPARRILQIRPFMPIIFCTGYSNLITEEKAKSLGIKGFAMKPLARKVLLCSSGRYLILDGGRLPG
jgi:CheY-like chemotaxis protein